MFYGACQFLIVLFFVRNISYLENVHFKRIKKTIFLMRSWLVLKVIWWKFLLNWRISDRFIAKYGRPSLEKRVKTFRFMDTLEHWVVIQFCVHEEKSPMGIKRFLDAAIIIGQRFINGTTIGIKGLKLKILIYWDLSPPRSPIQTAWTEIFGPTWSTILHKRHCSKINKQLFEQAFYKWANGMKSVWTKRCLFWKKKSDRFKLPFSSLTSPDVVEIWLGAP